VEILPQGFAVTRRGDRREYFDRDVDALSCAFHADIEKGERQGATRSFRVWVGGEHRPIALDSYLAPGGADPLKELIDRLIDASVARAEHKLRQGGAVEGPKWRLDATAFHFGPSAAIALVDVTAIDEFGGRLCIWRRGTPKAVFRIPINSRNAIVLLRVLRSQLKNQAVASPKQPEEADDLGRILFERRQAYLLAAIILAMGIIVAAAAIFTPDPFIVFMAAAIFAAVGGFILFFQARTFRCHQRGLVLSTLLGKRTLRYAEIEEFTYEAVRHFGTNRTYKGSELAMTFSPDRASGAKTIEFDARIYAPDLDLESLRDFISRTVARRMKERLANDGVVEWTPGLSFVADGLVYREARFIGRAKAQTIPYWRCERFAFADGVFKVFSPDDNLPLISEKTRSRNFFPGYLLLCELTGKSA